MHEKKEARGWRVLKCKSLVDVKSVPTRTGPQSTPSSAISHRAMIGNLRTFVGYLYHSTMLAPMKGAYENEAKGMESLKM